MVLQGWISRACALQKVSNTYPPSSPPRPRWGNPALQLRSVGRHVIALAVCRTQTVRCLSRCSNVVLCFKWYVGTPQLTTKKCVELCLYRVLWKIVSMENSDITRFVPTGQIHTHSCWMTNIRQHMLTCSPTETEVYKWTFYDRYDRYVYPIHGCNSSRKATWSKQSRLQERNTY